MKNYIYLLFLFLFACGEDRNYNQSQFNREEWLANPKMEYVYNPRANMTEDLLNNVLKPGLTRDSILLLLGEPYAEKITYRLPIGLSTPDSLALHNFTRESKELQDQKLNHYNAWYKSHSQPDTLMLYPVGWSLIDPNFLAIKFSPDSVAYEFWVEQH